MLGVNNGPNLYRPDLGEGNVLVGGISPKAFTASNTTHIASIYRSLNVPGIRPNDQGGPFDIRCMFPIDSIDAIPPENSTFEDISSDPRWNWTSSDAVFAAMLENGFAPYLKLASREWISGIQQGLAYVREDGVPEYVVQPTSLEQFCKSWPYISPIMESIGDKLMLTVVERYNNASKWSDYMSKGLKDLPPLEWRSWANATNATVGVELQNEYNFLTCLPTGSGDNPSIEGWRENCGGEPYTWSAKYWDGTPSGAHKSFVSQAIAIKERFPGIRVGGPAIGTSGSFGLQPNSEGKYPADGIALDWIRDFLKTIADSSKDSGIQLLDWFSWHAYTNCQTTGGGTDCTSENPTSMLGIATRMRQLLDSEGFQDLPMVISEHNANFAINGGNSYPGNVQGAAITAANLIQLYLSKENLKINGAYIVNGIDGTFVPGSKNSFPLTCPPEYTVIDKNNNKTTMGPSRIIFSGRYVNNCTYGNDLIGAMSINSANGMGLLYSNGDRKPSAIVYEEILSGFLSDFVEPPPIKLPSSITGLYAKSSSEPCSKLLLVNVDPFNYSSALPNIVADNHSDVQVSQVVQNLRGGPDIVLPNQISNLGTVQVEGRVVNDKLTNSGLVDDQGELRLPPAGIAIFTICSHNENNSSLSNASGTASLSHMSYIDWIICIILLVSM
eukprot:jgi/Picsp_1/5569/NSC_02928-R1_glycoside hydrolase